MNKSHNTARSGTNARTALAAARVHYSMLEPDDDELDEIRDDPSLPAAILDDDDDWAGDDDAHAGPRFRSDAYESLAPETESELNLLLHGVACR